MISALTLIRDISSMERAIWIGSKADGRSTQGLSGTFWILAVADVQVEPQLLFWLHLKILKSINEKGWTQKSKYGFKMTRFKVNLILIPWKATNKNQRWPLFGLHKENDLYVLLNSLIDLCTMRLTFRDRVSIINVTCFYFYPLDQLWIDLYYDQFYLF